MGVDCMPKQSALAQVGAGEGGDPVTSRVQQGGVAGVIARRQARAWRGRCGMRGRKHRVATLFVAFPVHPTLGTGRIQAQNPLQTNRIGD